MTGAINGLPSGRPREGADSAPAVRVLVTETAGHSKHVVAWAWEHDFPLDQITTVSPDALQAAIGSQDCDVAIIVNSPIEEETDLLAMEVFAAHVVAAPGNWYYAPRPHDYLTVDAPALVGINPVPTVAGDSSDDPTGKWYSRFKDRVRSGVERLPEPAASIGLAFGRAALRAGRNVLLSRPMSESHSYPHQPAPEETCQDATLPVASSGTESPPRAPVVATPYALLAWEGWQWAQWRPQEDILRRDLIERVDRFFPHPRGIHVVVLNKCNLKCVMCPFHAPVYRAHTKNDFFDSYKSMSEETFTKIADYAGENGIALQFGQLEEPLMHKGVIGFIRLARKRGVRSIHMTTNGTLITPDKAKALADSGLTSLMVSLDAATPETYRDIRGFELDEVEANLRNFIPMAKARGMKVWVSFILQPQAMAERDAFLDKWRQMGVDNVTFYALSEHDTETGEIIHRKEIYEKTEKRYPCASPWVDSVVFPNGEVSLCCRTIGLVGWRDVISVGSLKETSYADIWKGERYQTVRRELLENVFNEFDICTDCSIWSAAAAVVEKTESYTRTYNETMDTYSFKN